MIGRQYRPDRTVTAEARELISRMTHQEDRRHRKAVSNGRIEAEIQRDRPGKWNPDKIYIIIITNDKCKSEAFRRRGQTLEHIPEAWRIANLMFVERGDTRNQSW